MSSHLAAAGLPAALTWLQPRRKGEGCWSFLEGGWALLSLPEGRNKITADELGWEEASAAADRAISDSDVCGLL